MVTVPVFFLAVMVAVFGPVDVTLAMPDDVEVHVSGGVGSTFPDASSAVTVTVIVVPVRMIGIGSDVVTASESSWAGGGGGGAFTVIVAVPFCPSLLAVIVAVPAATAVTTPLLDTVATDWLLDDQSTTRPVRTLPCESFVVAESVVVVPTSIVAVVGETSTVATGTGAGAVTVIVALPVFPSLVAVIVAMPGATAVTVPEALTVATPFAVEAHTIWRPVRVCPCASYVTAVSVTVDPVTTVLDGGATVTELTGTGAGALTLIVALPVLPSLVAVIVALPALFAVTTPDVLTDATAGALDAQTMPRPVSVFPFASYVMAVSVVVAPTVSELLVGATATDATGMAGGDVTVIAALAVLPSLVAVTVALPCATDVTIPFPSTVATDGALDAHVTGRPVSALPF